MKETTTTFFAAAGDLAGELLAQLKRDDPAAHGAVSTAMQHGAFFTLTVAFGAGGPIDTRLVLMSPAGEPVTLFEVDFAEPPQ